ncbi:MAG TPA: serine hydrolase domain-containing protein [Candidatus Acidoferrum sp.]|jgi:CubicO group peptidase (beta-lactamase class C family)|nr:serine hydrolase domain-containing protein [Candidatus Acidoferrum sp.]
MYVKIMHCQHVKISLSVALLIKVAAGFLVFSMIPGTASGQDASNPSTVIQNIDAIFAPLVTPHSPGVAVLVVKDGKELFERGYGVRDLHSAAKIDPRTNFRLASCSKQFTAMAIMLLVHDGKLRYDQKLTDVFPDFPAYGRAISIRNLLNHTGGLQDYETLMEQAGNAGKWNEDHQIQDGEVLILLEQTDHGMFQPGRRWYYSNSGYVVLGLVVAKVSGQPFPEFLRERIFAPLKMDNTVAYVKGKNEITNRAYGHTKERDRWKQTDQSSTSATLGDGGINSSLEDLGKWDEALRSNKLLSKEEMQPALTPVTLPTTSVNGNTQPRWPANSDRPEGTPVSYGFGWFLDPYRGHPRMWHYGETRGFHSYVVRFTKHDLTIIVLCNRTDISPEALALQVADPLLVSPK